MNSSNHSVLILFELCLFFNKKLKGTIVFCRLELAYKDAVKKVSLYDSAIVLLMGLYYFYKNSPKQRSNLNLTFEALGDKKVLPTRVGGTRWVGHVVLAVETFFKAYNAIVTHLGDVVQQKKSQV